MMPRIVVGYGNAAHAGPVCGNDALLGVFQDQTLGRRNAEIGRGLEKNVRRRFHPRDIQAADDDLKKIGDAETGENAVDCVAIRR